MFKFIHLNFHFFSSAEFILFIYNCLSSWSCGSKLQFRKNNYVQHIFKESSFGLVDWYFSIIQKLICIVRTTSYFLAMLELSQGRFDIEYSWDCKFEIRSREWWNSSCETIVDKYLNFNKLSILRRYNSKLQKNIVIRGFGFMKKLP